MAYLGWAAAVSLLVPASAMGAAPAPAAAWGPADVCAIAARPESPGHDQTADPGKGARASAVHARTDWRMGGWDPKWKARPEWGPCPIDRVRFDELYFTADGRFAKTLGGWQAGPLAGAWGYCLFEKRGKAWDVLGCEITAIS
ncbi:MAG TPA: hypothetical protein VF619_08485 [Allosphingosinicella sp.]|jgi:hypothetical protein